MLILRVVNWTLRLRLRARVAGKARVDATANVDNGAQPYFVLERAATAIPDAAADEVTSAMLAL